MPRADRIAIAGLLAALAVAGCSETTWRRSTMEHVQVEGRELSVSWIRLQPDEVEVSVWEEPFFQGTAARGETVLPRPLARRAADVVAAERCPRGYDAAPTPGLWAEGHHAFRFRCRP